MFIYMRVRTHALKRVDKKNVSIINISYMNSYEYKSAGNCIFDNTNSHYLVVTWNMGECWPQKTKSIHYNFIWWLHGIWVDAGIKSRIFIIKVVIFTKIHYSMISGRTFILRPIGSFIFMVSKTLSRLLKISRKIASYPK